MNTWLRWDINMIQFSSINTDFPNDVTARMLNTDILLLIESIDEHKMFSKKTIDYSLIAANKDLYKTSSGYEIDINSCTIYNDNFNSKVLFVSKSVTKEQIGLYEKLMSEMKEYGKLLS